MCESLCMGVEECGVEGVDNNDINVSFKLLFLDIV